MDDATEEDIAGLPQECFENDEYVGYPITKAEFAICFRNFTNLVAARSFEDASAHGLTLDEQALQEWIGYQEKPVSIIDQPMSALWYPFRSLTRHSLLFPTAISLPI